MRRDKGFLARVGERLDIPAEVLPGGFSLSLSGRRELTVSGCRRILCYGEEEMRLLLGKTVLSVCGHALVCTAFGGGSVTLSGEILSLSFEGEMG